jgi:hypothetical protein
MSNNIESLLVTTSNRNPKFTKEELFNKVYETIKTKQFPWERLNNHYEQQAINVAA